MLKIFLNLKRKEFITWVGAIAPFLMFVGQMAINFVISYLILKHFITTAQAASCAIASGIVASIAEVGLFFLIRYIVKSILMDNWKKAKFIYSMRDNRICCDCGSPMLPCYDEWAAAYKCTKCGAVASRVMLSEAIKW